MKYISYNLSNKSLNLLDNIFTRSNIDINQNYLKNEFDSLHIIERGGFGIVFSGEDKSSKIYAIKLVPFFIDKSNPELVTNCRIQNKLKEVRYLSDFDHPNIIKFKYSWIEIGNILSENIIRCENCFDFFSKNKIDNSLNTSLYSYSNGKTIEPKNQILVNVNIQMEIMDLSLKEYIKTIKLDEREINFIIQSILNGVEYLHNKLIIHCDLKPANILLKIFNNKITAIKIADFGLVMERNYSKKDNYGTPFYTPSEVSEGIITNKYDIYSIGIIIIELINEFKTTMEKVDYIKKLTKSNNNKKNIPNITINNLLIKMIHNNHKERPTLDTIRSIFTNYYKK